MNEALIATAKAYAAKFGLAPALVCAVCEQESNWDPWAVRYESAFFAKYVHNLELSIMEGFHRSTSWGLMQIMGEVARELGFKGPFLTQLCDVDEGLTWGCIKLKECLAVKSNLADALQRWNGGGNPNYSAEVMARIPKYQ